MVSIKEKKRETRLRWLEYVLRRNEVDAVRLVKRMYVRGKSEREDRKRDADLKESDMMWIGVSE